MKEDIKRVHGLSRTKDLTKGLADKQAPFISVVRPLVSALQELEQTSKADVESDGPLGLDPDYIKALVEDAIVLPGNGHCRLNSWRENEFQLTSTIREEHDHANTNRKVVAQYTKPQKYLSPRGRIQVINKTFRDQSFQ